MLQHRLIAAGRRQDQITLLSLFAGSAASRPYDCSQRSYGLCDSRPARISREFGERNPARSWLCQRIKSRATVKKFLMAFIEGLQVYAQKKDFTLDVMQKYARLRDREAMAKSHDYFLKNTTLVPLTDPVAIKNALADRAAGRKLEDFFDNSIVQELIDEGFVEKVSKER